MGSHGKPSLLQDIARILFTAYSQGINYLDFKGMRAQAQHRIVDLGGKRLWH
jgi:hypothetical protein